MSGQPEFGAELFRRDPRPPYSIERRRFASYLMWRQLLSDGHIDHEQLVADVLGVSRHLHSPHAHGYRYMIPEILPDASRSRLTAAVRDALDRLPREPAGRLPLDEAVIRLVAIFGPLPIEWLKESVIRTVFSALDPRDVEFTAATFALAALDNMSVADPQRLSLVLADLPEARLLCVARRARPDLLAAVHAVFDSTDEAWAVLSYLASSFPPTVDIPAPDDPRLLAGLRALAEGLPGDTVAHGLFPSPITKLARLCLSSMAHYPPAEVLEAARRAYDTGRPYCAHDAVACALVHPQISAAERADLVRHLSALDPDGSAAHGWRLRKKFWRIVRWARRGWDQP
ncbi:hypothetical protein [Nocardia asteroides]|uniref:hypothetical protein n=1 Tax=Nocardia asteroides TaxID=1824 RepID=UPI001E4D8D38|nr:hypothetical protein [Nocardia asteroides]UGT57207.1 hypothetical protein LTT85_10335 [Nocardia asteroides]